MNLRKLLVLSLLTLASSVFGDDLTLSDGRVLTDYRILSETATTVMIRHKKGLSKVEKRLLPANVLGKHPIDLAGAATEAAEVARGKAEYAAQVAAEKIRRVSDPAAPRTQSWQVPPARDPETAADTRRQQDEERTRELKGRAQMALITTKAKDFADHFFRYDYLAGLNGAVVSRLDLELENPTPVTGWPNRFAVEGNCALEYYDSFRVGYNKKRAGAFRVLVESKDGQVKAIDLSMHYAPR